MRSGNNLKGYIAGLIAGFASAIVMIIFNYSGLWEALSVYRYGYIPVDVQISVLFEIIYGTIWGIIWGVFYAYFYDTIPSKGVKKGLTYGLIIWMITGLRFAVISIPYGGYLWTTPFAISTFFSIAITYGLLIGYLYKPKK